MRTYSCLCSARCQPGNTHLPRIQTGVQNGVCVLESIRQIEPLEAAVPLIRPLALPCRCGLPRAPLQSGSSPRRRHLLPRHACGCAMATHHLSRAVARRAEFAQHPQHGVPLAASEQVRPWRRSLGAGEAESLRVGSSRDMREKIRNFKNIKASSSEVMGLCIHDSNTAATHPRGTHPRGQQTESLLGRQTPELDCGEARIAHRLRTSNGAAGIHQHRGRMRAIYAHTIGAPCVIV